MPPSSLVRILIADDDEAIRLLLRRVLETKAEWEVCAEAAHGQEAIDRTLQSQPDIAILDLAMPGMNGLQAACEISKCSPHTSLLLVTVEEVTRALVMAARETGFAGAVTKSRGPEVIQAVEALLRKETYFVLEDSKVRVA